MLKNGRADQCVGKLSYNGCSCHNDKAKRRKATHILKRRETRAWKVTEKSAY